MGDDGELWSADEATRRTREAAARFRAAVRVEGVLGALLPEEPMLARLTRQRAADEDRFALLSGLAPEAPEFKSLLESLEAAVTSREQALRAVDAELPRERFRECFHEGAFEAEALADYVAVLARAAEVDDSLLDRVGVLLSAVVRQCSEGGPALRAVVGEVLQPSTLPPEVLDAAVQWFQDAARRATEAPSLEALIEADYFLELRLYRSSLHRTLLAPEVMTASVELKSSVADLIARESKGEPTEAEALWQHLARADAEARQRLEAQRAHDARPPVPSAPRARPSAPSPAKTPRPALRADRPGAKWLTYNRVVAFALVLAVVGLVAQQAGSRTTRELGTAEAQVFTPLLTEAMLAPVEHPRVLIGRFDRAAWKGTPVAQRQVVARDLATRITSRGLTSATVMIDETVVVQIEQGRVLIVE